MYRGVSIAFLIIGNRNTVIIHPAQFVIVVNGTHFDFIIYGMYIQTIGPNVNPNISMQTYNIITIVQLDPSVFTAKHVPMIARQTPTPIDPICNKVFLPRFLIKYVAPKHPTSETAWRRILQSLIHSDEITLFRISPQYRTTTFIPLIC